ncbi:MAG TPA: serine/threonine-protein kinase, partial [Anaerolineae bacterium]
MSAWTGKQIGKYEVNELIGHGAIGEVYKGYHPALKREVAIKVIQTHTAKDPLAIKRFQREAQIVAALRHPNIVQVHDFDIQEDTFYMVMEFVPGQTLADVLRALRQENDRLSLTEAMRLFQLIAQAVAYAHGRGVVHGDLKPANVLLTSERQPILADFGLSRMMGTERLAETGSITGTPAYMSPEQCAGNPGEERSDIYSLGIMLYEMTTGSLPFSGDSIVAVLMKQIGEPPPPARSINRDLPTAL